MEERGVKELLGSINHKLEMLIVGETALKEQSLRNNSEKRPDIPLSSRSKFRDKSYKKGLLVDTTMPLLRHLNHVSKSLMIVGSHPANVALYELYRELYIV